MNIKNYTSEVPVDKSIMLIEKLLVEAGATNISKFYSENEVTGIYFNIPINGIPIVFRLPSKSDFVYHRMIHERRSTTAAQRTAIWNQAKRTAWKMLYEWVHLQVSMILLEQVEVMEAFLPYAYDQQTNQTLYDKAKDSEFKLLGN